MKERCFTPVTSHGAQGARVAHILGVLTLLRGGPPPLASAITMATAAEVVVPKPVGEPLFAELQDVTCPVVLRGRLGEACLGSPTWR